MAFCNFCGACLSPDGTIVSNDPNNMITVNVESSGDGSRFQITSVLKKDLSSNP